MNIDKTIIAFIATITIFCFAVGFVGAVLFG